LIVEIGREIDEVFVETDFEDATYDVGAAAFSYGAPRFQAPGPHFAFSP
jgi:hypothetical protein